MSVGRRVLSRLLRLPPASHARLVLQRDLQARMPDGAVLLADRWFPQGHDGDLPTVLIRSPYGRRGLWAFEAPLLAERGYNVVVQSCRGCHGSEGEFVPFVNEAVDGAATLDWVHAQVWCDGRVATFGSSYLGITQHALAAEAPPGRIGAMAPSVGQADLTTLFRPFGLFGLQSAVNWLAGIDPRGERSLRESLIGMRQQARDVARAVGVRPLREADVVACGRPVDFYRDWVDHAADDPWWKQLDYRSGLTRQQPPISLVSGWFDLNALGQLDDAATLLTSGRDVQLTVGPWHHSGGLGLRIRHSLELFDRVLKNAGAPRRAKPVHLQLFQDDRWLGFDTWPVPSQPWRLHLQPGGRLAAAPASESAPTTFEWSPADPAPYAGGPALTKGGPKDQTDREARPDVVCFTSDPVPTDTALIGRAKASIHIDAGEASYDVAVTLCVVDRKGVSRNVSEAVSHVRAHSTGPVELELWPTGVLVRSGERLRLQVSGALHPLWACDTDGCPGGGPAGSRAVGHDPDRPSWIELPVVDVGGSELP